MGVPVDRSRLLALEEAVRVARALVDPRSPLIMCHHEREADFEDGNGCNCLACMTAQELVDALAMVPEEVE
jgi:hypothetical protein